MGCSLSGAGPLRPPPGLRGGHSFPPHSLRAGQGERVSVEVGQQMPRGDQDTIKLLMLARDNARTQLEQLHGLRHEVVTALAPLVVGSVATRRPSTAEELIDHSMFLSSTELPCRRCGARKRRGG